jgi:hypothetical protein
MEHHSIMNKNEILSFGDKLKKKWKTLIDEISQTQKDRYQMFSLMCGI